eukprot:c32338_g1_i1.p1 GENE.c32338_g1_i1~~c32338_g1_i1.p1  ORF type:complete len:891 (+),score=218.16 c32338_g1_i1:209-2674(+)
MNFQMAFEKLGVAPENRACIFRFDDTNPEKESVEYIESLIHDVAWMGWKPVQTTYSSDYFGKLHELAVELIKRGKAYVCHQTGEEIEKCREVIKARKARKEGEPMPEGQYLSPYRDRSVEENLRLFEEMRRGFFDEGAACLRMKMDMESNNPNMWDQVAYRIKYVPHPHVGSGWCIYPTYDYTHCIIDSLEHIDYSICTLEFETRRESYYWVLEALDLYRPKVYEFARLNLTYTLLSKRKLLKLVTTNRVRGWDDPRMPTISGYRRKGYTPTIINAFCTDIGVTRVNTLVEMEKMEHHARLELNNNAKRVMVVFDPITLVISNLPANHAAKIDVPDFPNAPERGSHVVTFTQRVLISARDFRTEADEDYFGLTPTEGASIGLRSAFPVIFQKLEKDASGKITIYVKADLEKNIRPKTWVNWVSATHSKLVEVRNYQPLFLAPEVFDDWEEQLNPNSEVVTHGVADKDWAVGPPGTSYQFEREGYYTVDTDSTSTLSVFNSTVSLAESGLKKRETEARTGKGKSRKEEQERLAKEKEQKAGVDPKEMFKSETDKYSKFDDQGVPTHDAEGKSLSKSSIKKLQKDWEKQKKLFEGAQKSPSSQPTESPGSQPAASPSTNPSQSPASAPAVSPAATPSMAAPAKKYDTKLLKAVEKEGGKLGQDIQGVNEMGGLRYFSTTVSEPDGDLGLLNISLDAMNAEVDESSEERRGGAGAVGKMLFSAGKDKLAIVARVPPTSTHEVSVAEWIRHVSDALGGTLVGEPTADYGQALVAADPSKGRYSIKLKDEGIAASVAYLQSKGVFPEENEGSGSDMVFGEDDFPLD